VPCLLTACLKLLLYLYLLWVSLLTFQLPGCLFLFYSVLLMQDLRLLLVAGDMAGGQRMAL